MYSYIGQGSPSVLSYQYGTERYVTNDSYMSGLGVETFDPRPQVHRQAQNDPALHRQNITQSGMMPMQKGQANLFPQNGKGRSYASSNLDSYIVDRHSSTQDYNELQSLGYMHDNSNNEEKQIKMLFAMGRFRDYKVKRFNYRLYENGLIQILPNSPFMVGRIISQSKRPKLYQTIIKNITDQQQELYGNPFLTIVSNVKDKFESAQDKYQQGKEVYDQAKDVYDAGQNLFNQNTSSGGSSPLLVRPLPQSLLTQDTSSSSPPSSSPPSSPPSSQEEELSPLIKFGVPVVLGIAVYTLFIRK